MWGGEDRIAGGDCSVRMSVIVEAHCADRLTHALKGERASASRDDTRTRPFDPIGQNITHSLYKCALNTIGTNSIVRRILGASQTTTHEFEILIPIEWPGQAQ